MESPLQFTRYDLTTGVPLTKLIPPYQNRRGIYVLHRDDGWEYVGKANRNVLDRYRRHHMEWGGSIISIDFAPVPEHVDEEELLAYESQTRDWRRSMGKSLWNKHDNQETLSQRLPPITCSKLAEELWSTHRGSTDEVARVPYRAPAPSGAAPEGKSERLFKDRDGDIVLNVLAHLVRLALPVPAITMGYRWKICSPWSHGKDEPSDLKRLATLAVHNVTLAHVRRHRSGELDVRLHLDPEHAVGLHYGFAPVPYPVMLEEHDIQRADMDPEQLIEALDSDQQLRSAVFHTAHRLMRRGQPTNKYGHDPALADAVFERIAELGLVAP